MKPKPPPLQAPSFTAKRDAKGTHLEWRIVPNLDGGLRAIRLHRDGKLRKENSIDEDAFLDICGNESPPSEAVRVP